VPGAHFEGFSGGPNNSVPNAPRNPSRDLNLWRLENTRHIDLPAEHVFGLWPFGYGLSYATIVITSAEMVQTEWKTGESPSVRVNLSNTSTRDGVAVVQIYLRDVEASVTRPDHRLAAFKTLAIAAGESATVEISIRPEMLEIIDTDGKRISEPGLFHALVGFSSLVTGLKILPFSIT
ncbi:MAG: fibronectin type III-like domain-contianing protein, partial [Luteolibacter sp.]